MLFTRFASERSPRVSLVAAFLLTAALSMSDLHIPSSFLDAALPLFSDVGVLLACCGEQDDELVALFSSLIDVHIVVSSAPRLPSHPLIDVLYAFSPSLLLSEMVAILDASTMVDLLLDSYALVDPLLLCLEFAESFDPATKHTLGELYTLLYRSQSHFPYNIDGLIEALAPFEDADEELERLNEVSSDGDSDS